MALSKMPRMAAVAKPDRFTMPIWMPPTELKPKPDTRMTAAMIRLRDLVRST